FSALLLGLGVVHREVEKRSFSSRLAKPIERHQLVLGKYAGLVLTLAVNLTVMAVALYVVLAVMAWVAGPIAARAWERPAVDPLLLKAFAMTFVELSLITAIALLFSTFSTPMLSAAFTFALFVAGRFSTDLRNFNQVVDSPIASGLTSALYWVLPNLAPFDVRSQVVHGDGVPFGYLAMSTGYGALYIAALLVLSTL